MLGQKGAFKLICYYLKDTDKAFWLSILAICPIPYLANGIGYGTDITWTVFVVWAFYYFAKYLDSDNNNHYLIGLICLVFSGTIRELSILFGLVFFIFSIYKKKPILKSALPLALLVVVYLSFKYWIESSGNVPLLMSHGSNQILDNFKDPLLLIKKYVLGFLKVLIFLSLFRCFESKLAENYQYIFLSIRFVIYSSRFDICR